MGKTILTVDDSTSVRQVVSFALRDAGYDTLEATDGRDALAKMSGNIGLVITDLNMPNMDGLQLIKHIRAGSTNKYVPIIVLTTESQPAKKQEAKSAGATGWIVKPFRPEQLIAVVQKVLG
jgi:two-component system, chemotaxis family, chemotaxis protein CheY